MAVAFAGRAIGVSSLFPWGHRFVPYGIFDHRFSGNSYESVVNTSALAQHTARL